MRSRDPNIVWKTKFQDSRPVARGVVTSREFSSSSIAEGIILHGGLQHSGDAQLWVQQPWVGWGQTPVPLFSRTPKMHHFGASFLVTSVSPVTELLSHKKLWVR